MNLKERKLEEKTERIKHFAHFLLHFFFVQKFWLTERLATPEEMSIRMTEAWPIRMQDSSQAGSAVTNTL